jgi:hypothetical protein
MTATLLKPGGLSRSEHVPNLGQNALRAPQHIRCGEAEQPHAGCQEPILAAIVFDEAGAMSVAVVLNAESLLPVIEIWASERGTLFIANGDLQLGRGKPVQDEQHS